MSELLKRFIAEVSQNIAELPDRNSPEDWPEAMLVTHEELSEIITNVHADFPAIASKQGEAVKPEWFSITDGDNWFECPDDSAILDCVHTVSVGTEYEVLAAYPSIRQTYRITKVPDDVSDDTEVELITSNGNLLYTHAPDSAARIAEQAAEIARLTKELEEAAKKCDNLVHQRADDYWRDGIDTAAEHIRALKDGE